MRVYPAADSLGGATDLAPDYSSGLYNTNYCQLYPLEVELLKTYASKDYTPASKFMEAMHASATGPKPIVGDDLPTLSRFIESSYFAQKPTDGLFDEMGAYQMPVEAGVSLSVDAIYCSQEDSLMAVLVFYLHEGEDFDPEKDYTLFFDLDWRKSSNEILVFKDGFADISNLKKSGEGINKPLCLVFNVVTVDIVVEEVTIRSVGFSILPLEDPDEVALQGYFQLPVFDEPFSFSLVDQLRSKNPWTFIHNLNRETGVKSTPTTLLVRLHLPQFEVDCR